MNQYYNQQGFQPYTGSTGQQAAQPYSAAPSAQATPYTSAGQQQYYPMYPPAGGQTPPTYSGGPAGQAGMLPLEQSYIENILRLNKGKLAHVYATFEGSDKWNSKEFIGIIEAAGRDHLILSDPQAGTRFLIPMVSLDYITFDEEIEYEYPYGQAPLTTYPPR